MEDFSPLTGLAGGLLIGTAAALLLVLNGRIAGVSGMLGGLLDARRPGTAARVAFVLGLPLGALVFALLTGAPVPVNLESSVTVLILAGLLVGFGTRFGSGCTSGHGICGVARLSRRSVTATLVFMAVAAATVFLTRHAL